MKLERALIELATLVDYGTEYLLDWSKMEYQMSRDILKEHPLDILPNMDQGDVLTYVCCNFTHSDIICELEMTLGEYLNAADMTDYDLLDSVNEQSIIDYAYNTLDMVTREDAFDFVQENFGISDMFDLNDIFNYIYENAEESDVIDFVTSNYPCSDFVCWQ